MKTGLPTNRDINWNAKPKRQQRQERLAALETQIARKADRLAQEQRQLAEDIKQADELRRLLGQTAGR